MPPVAIAVAAAAAEYGAVALAVDAGIVVAGSLGAAMIGALAASVVAFAGAALFGQKPKSPDQPSLGPSAGGQVTSRQPIPVWEVVYGFQRKGGALTFESVAGSSNRELHLVITLSCHEVAAIGDMYIAGKPVGLDASGNATSAVVLDANGNTIVPAYAGFITVEKNLGTADQVAFPGLMAALPTQWTADHRQRGRAGVHVTLIWDQNTFAGFDPSQITFDIWGHNQILDPRTDTRGFTDNAALVVAEYLTNPTYGMQSDATADMSADDYVSEANVCDETVAVANTSAPFTADPSTATLTITEGLAPTGMWAPLIGDQVTIASDGTLPTGLAAATTYYWIPKGYVAGVLEEGTSDTFKGQLASSLMNALARTPIGFSDAGSGTLTLTRTGERRYTCNGVITLDRAPRDIITGLLSAMGGTAGRAIWTGGVWMLQAGAYRTPAITLGPSDLRKDGFRIQMLNSRQSSFNGVKGQFTNPAKDWQPDIYPPVTSPAYVTADGGERAWNQMDLPMTLSGSMAQRIARMELNRGRLEKQIPQLPCKLTALQLRAGSTMMFDWPRFGWTPKAFETSTFNFGVEADANGIPVIGIDLALRETDPSAYAWSSGDEQPIAQAPPSTLPNPYNVMAPNIISVTESLYVTRENSVKSQVQVVWTGNDAFAGKYQLEYALTGTGNWSVLPQIGETQLTIFDIQPEAYDFRVKAINTFGVASSYSTLVRKEIKGLSAPPVNVANISLSAVNGLAVIHFDPSPDLDVQIGGYGQVRWSPAATGAQWQNGIDVGPKIAPTATQTILPLGAGTYMVKWVNSNGVASLAAAMAVTNAPSLISFGTGITITESPAFGGVKTNCYVDGGLLLLVGSDLVDDIPDVDSIVDWDSDGGIVAAGSYAFAAEIDLGSVKPHRLTTNIAIGLVNVLSLIDSRTADVDDWDDWDGTSAAAGTAQLWVADTDDDPTGAPTWGAWNRLNPLSDHNCRAHKFRFDITTTDPAYNVETATLAVTANY